MEDRSRLRKTGDACVLMWWRVPPTKSIRYQFFCSDTQYRSFGTINSEHPLKNESWSRPPSELAFVIDPNLKLGDLPRFGWD